VIAEDMYKVAIEAKNFEALRILYENDLNEENITLRRIVKYDLLKVAVESNNFSLVEKVIQYEPITYNNIHTNEILIKAILLYNIPILKLLIDSFILNSSSTSKTKYNNCNNYNEEEKEQFMDDKSNDNCKMKINENQYDIKYLNFLLNLAIQNNNFNLVKFIIENYNYEGTNNINEKDIHQEYPIITALYSSDFEIFKYLLDHGANYNTKNDNGLSLLLLAIQKNKLKFVECLLLKSNLNINEKDYNGISPLMKAINQNNSSIVEQLINYNNKRKRHDYHYHDDDQHRHKKIKLVINEKDNKGNCPLIKAIHRNNFDIVFSLVNYGIKNNFDMNVKDSNGNTPLTLSYKYRFFPIFKYLTRYLNINQKDSIGRTILHYVVKKEDIELTRKLIRIGADIYLNDEKGHSPIDIAIASGNAQLLKCLFDKCNISLNYNNYNGDCGNDNNSINNDSNNRNNRSDDNDDDSINGNNDNNNVKSNGNNKEGFHRKKTILISILKSKKYTLEEKTFFMKDLLEKGINVNAVNKKGYSALSYALQFDLTSVVKTLIENGADVNHRDINGNSLLYTLAKDYKFELFKLLYKEGAPLYIDHKLSKFYFDDLLKITSYEILNYLYDHGHHPIEDMKKYSTMEFYCTLIKRNDYEKFICLSKCTMKALIQTWLMIMEIHYCIYQLKIRVWIYLNI